MTSKQSFDELVGGYRKSPEFYSVNFLDANQTGLTGDTLLHAAVIRGNVCDIDILLSAGAKVDIAGDLGNTPLHHAASRGMVEITRKLLQHGADPTLRNEFGQTPLDLAALRKRQRIVDIFKSTSLRSHSQ